MTDIFSTYFVKCSILPILIHMGKSLNTYTDVKITGCYWNATNKCWEINYNITWFDEKFNVWLSTRKLCITTEHINELVANMGYGQPD